MTRTGQRGRQSRVGRSGREWQVVGAGRGQAGGEQHGRGAVALGAGASLLPPAGPGLPKPLATPALPRRLALFGLPPGVAEPVSILAEILGWQVLLYPPGPAMRPPARACLAMLPACNAALAPPLLFWSPENNLNEHISRAGMSIMDQPLCITRVEQMLEALGCEP